MNISSVAPLALSQGAASATSVQRQSQEAEVPEGITVDADKFTVITGRTLDEQRDYDYRIELENRDIPLYQANQALTAIETEVGKIQKSLKASRPALAGAAWDFTVENGKLKVTGGISDADKSFLEAKLNGNSTLRGAVGSYVKAAAKYLETTAENPAYSAKNSFTGSVQSFEFSDVAKKFEGKVGFRDLLTSTTNFGNGINGGKVVDKSGMRGWVAMDMVASRLS